VPNALGEGPKTLREAFAKCNTQGRASGDASHGEATFPECRASSWGRFNVVDAIHLFFLFFKKLFPECNTRGRNSFFKKESSSPSATLGEEI
jgi:hypothetical protein